MVPVADNVEVVAYADHDRLMSGEAPVIGHGGLGTGLRALAHGVPQLLLPLGGDQGFNASRVEQLSAGIDLPPAQHPAGSGPPCARSWTTLALPQRVLALRAASLPTNPSAAPARHSYTRPADVRHADAASRAPTGSYQWWSCRRQLLVVIRGVVQPKPQLGDRDLRVRRVTSAIATSRSAARCRRGDRA